MIFFVQLGKKKAKVNFSKIKKKKKKKEEPTGRVQFFYLFQIAREKSLDYFLITYMQFYFKFLLSISPFCTQFQLSAITVFGINCRALNQSPR